MTSNKHTFTAALACLAIAAATCGSAWAQTAKGAMLAKQANEITVTAQDTVVRAEKLHPSANRSYKVAGKRYQPLTKVSSFSQSGSASWYGSQFHGRKTASGERYDMYAMTAAHRTLPIPSYARVTNTRNGKSVIVRVNDRGPFHGSRVMDLSKAAAQKLGFLSQGTAQVKIEQVVPGIRQAQDEAAPAADMNAQAFTPVLPAKDIYVDLRSFGTEREAQAYMNQTAAQLALAQMSPKIAVEKRSYEYVVRMGPFSAQERADEAATRVRNIMYTAQRSAI